MLKDIIELIKDVSLRHHGVYTFRYQDKIYNNQQNNNKTYQVYVEDISHHQLNLTTNVFKAEFQMYILAQPNGESGNTILDVQNNAYTIAVNILAYLDSQDAFSNVLSVYDYDILTLSHYTDDDSAGVKLSFVLQMPSPLNWCTLEENFDDKPHEEPKDHEINISGTTISEELSIRPIRLPRRNNC